MKATYTRRAITNKDIDTIILNDTYGMSPEENAEKSGFSNRTVYVILEANKAIRSQDWTRCINLIWKNRAPLSTFSWLASRNGIELPPEIESEYTKMLEASRKGIKASKPKAEEPKPEEPEERPRLTNEERFFIGVLNHLNAQTKLIAELNEQLNKVLALLS